MFLEIVQDGKSVLSTEGLRYTLAKPADEAWRTGRDTSGLSAPDPTNVHALHRGCATCDVWAQLVAQLESLVPRDVQAAQPIKATHRKIGPCDVYMAMGTPKNSAVEFRAKGQAELWDPWTGATRPLSVLTQTAAGTRFDFPLADGPMSVPLRCSLPVPRSGFNWYVPKEEPQVWAERRGVPFLWTFRLFKEWALVNCVLLIVFNVLDQAIFNREERLRPGSQLEEVQKARSRSASRGSGTSCTCSA